MALPANFASPFRGGNVAPRPQPMAPTMGTAIRGMFGGGGMPVTPMPTMGQGIGQAVRGMAQAPNRTGGIGDAVRGMNLKPTPTIGMGARRVTGRMVNNRRGMA